MKREVIKKPNHIILGSTGRNTGKTEFACHLIRQHAKAGPIYGVKVVCIDPAEGNCPRGGKGCEVCSSLNEDYEITQETEHHPGKDTSRMLMAGAHQVYFLKAKAHALENGLKALLEIIPDDALTICESNSLRKVLEPGLFLVIKNLEEEEIKDSCAEVIGYANKVIHFSNMGWDFNPGRVHIKNNHWVIRENASAIILAGGKSSRMGGVDKSLLPVADKTLISHIVTQLEGHFDEILIGANGPEKYTFLNKRVIPDIESGKGPLMGICSCLKASQNEVNFITACDIPQMNMKLIQHMINISANADMVIPKNHDKHEPLYAVYKNTVADKAEEILKNNGRRITDLLDHCKAEFVDIDQALWYKNLNTKEAYINYIKK